MLTQNPGAQFYYSTDGNLLGMKLSYMDIEKNDTIVKHKLSWESALTLFLNSYTKNSRIQHLLQSGSYTITSIRSAWDMSETNDGTYGWLITLSSTIPAQDSPIFIVPAAYITCIFRWLWRCSGSFRSFRIIRILQRNQFRKVPCEVKSANS